MIARRAITAIALFALAATACGHGKAQTKARDATPRGGTLIVAEPESGSAITNGDTQALDPQIEYIGDTWEILRCCLARTLLSHTGQTTANGGTILRPDLALALPNVSADGLTWTFHLRRGIHYGPPLQGVEVTSADFLRAFRREAKLGTYNSYYGVIKGFDDYGQGKSDSIGGIQTPDAYTVAFQLTEPSGDFGYRLALAATAPIPALPSAMNAPFGVATGHDHDGYGRFLVSSGPYMIEGSEKVDFSAPAKKQHPASGMRDGKLIVLVRNPSWSSDTDALRPAYVDRIEIHIVPDTVASRRLTLSGKADVLFELGGPDSLIPPIAVEVQRNPSLGSVLVASSDFIFFAGMNLAVPPFDDVEVRRAANLVVDKKRLQALWGGPYIGSIANHVGLDSLENNLLSNYDPYGTADHAGDLGLAKQHMAKSRYDRNHDGVCDADVCRGLVAPTNDVPTRPEVGREIVRDLARIGIHMRLKVVDGQDLYSNYAPPERRSPILLPLNWGKDFLNASNYFEPLFTFEDGGSDYSLVGVSPAQLRTWGYSVRSVPAVDDRIKACQALVGEGQTSCWASLDQYLMEQIVPWIPYQTTNRVVLLSSRVVASSISQLATEPALDRIALKPGS